MVLCRDFTIGRGKRHTLDRWGWEGTGVGGGVVRTGDQRESDGCLDAALSHRVPLLVVPKRAALNLLGRKRRVADS